MRIIAGKYRGRLLTAANDRSVRPTTDRAKQTIFDILSTRVDFNEINVLDLFAGSGSLGLEALSRGAAAATFVDNSRKSLAVLEKNIKALDCKARATIYQAEAFWYLRTAGQAYDLVFADPPYKLENIGELPERVFESRVLPAGGYFVMEHSKSSEVEPSPGQYEVTKKPFGQTTVLILRKLPPA